MGNRRMEHWEWGIGNGEQGNGPMGIQVEIVGMGNGVLVLDCYRYGTVSSSDAGAADDTKQGIENWCVQF